jgi:predicted nucleic acid-binding protein
MNNSSTVCVDANIIVRLVLFSEDDIQTLWKNWESDEKLLIAPTVLHYEVVNSLYQYQKHGQISSASLERALQAALALPIELVDDDYIHRRAILLAAQYGLPAAYDSHYLALAEWMNIELWTADARLVNALKPYKLDWVKLI